MLEGVLSELLGLARIEVKVKVKGVRLSLQVCVAFLFGVGVLGEMHYFLVNF